MSEINGRWYVDRGCKISKESVAKDGAKIHQLFPARPYLKHRQNRKNQNICLRGVYEGKTISVPLDSSGQYPLLETTMVVMHQL